MDEDYNRDNVNKIKKMIIAVFFIMFLIPTALCIILLFKINKLESKLDEKLKENDTKIEELKKEEKVSSDSDAKRSVKEEKVKADEHIEKDTTAKNLLTVHDATRTDAEKASKESNVKPNGKKVYLTFDDGPSAYTDEILDILKEENVKATFFVVVNEDSRGDQLRRITREGHTIAIHSASHDYKKIYKDIRAFMNDVETAGRWIYDITGVKTKYYRFPGGSSNDVSQVPIKDCIDYLNKQGYTYYDWNAMNDDAETTYHTADELKDTALGYVRNNGGDSVVLMHDLEGHHETVEALKGLIETLKAEGYTILPITDETTPVQHVSAD